MTALAPRLRAERTQPLTGAAAGEDHEASLVRNLRVALDDYLNGRKLVRVKIRQAEGRSVEGFLKIEGGKSKRLLVDFKATETPQGGLSSLEVGGSKVSLVPDAAAKRTH
jgi:hypothetical protein